MAKTLSMAFVFLGVACGGSNQPSNPSNIDVIKDGGGASESAPATTSTMVKPETAPVPSGPAAGNSGK